MDGGQMQKASCVGKEAYLTPRLANGVAKRRRQRGQVVNAYRCRHCGKYHVGHGKTR